VRLGFDQIQHLNHVHANLQELAPEVITHTLSSSGLPSQFLWSNSSDSLLCRKVRVAHGGEYAPGKVPRK
jgi:hypothetical protein